MEYRHPEYLSEAKLIQTRERYQAEIDLARMTIETLEIKIEVINNLIKER